MLDRGAFRLLRLGQHLAEIPEGIGLGDAGRHDGVAHHLLLEAERQDVLDQRPCILGRATRRNLHQHVPGPVLGQRPRHAVGMQQGEVVWATADQFEGGERRAGTVTGKAEQGERRLGRIQPDKRHLPPLRLGEQLEHGGGDDAQRALGADEQVLEVVAGVVLLEFAQVIEHLAGRQHHLDAEAEFAGIAIGEHAGAAGVGGKVAADLAGSLRRER